MTIDRLDAVKWIDIPEISLNLVPTGEFNE
jgi:hypothetical protein